MNAHAAHQSTWPGHISAPADQPSTRSTRKKIPRPGDHPLRIAALLIAEFVWVVIYSAFTLTATIVTAIAAILAVPIMGFVCVGLIGLALYLMGLFFHGLGLV